MGLSRAEKVRAIAACEALASELRADLGELARAEFEAEGSAPTWRIPNVGTLSVSVTNPSVRVQDPAVFLTWVKARYPSEVYEVREERIREVWQKGFLSEVLGRGAMLCDGDGEVVPGLEYVGGGQYRSVSLLVQAQVKDELREVAREIAAGRLPLALPGAAEA